MLITTVPVLKQPPVVSRWCFGPALAAYLQKPPEVPHPPSPLPTLCQLSLSRPTFVGFWMNQRPSLQPPQSVFLVLFPLLLLAPALWPMPRLLLLLSRLWSLFLVSALVTLVMSLAE